ASASSRPPTGAVTGEGAGACASARPATPSDARTSAIRVHSVTRMRRRLLGITSAENAMMALTAAMVATGGGGCSFMFSQGAPAAHARRAFFDCGENLPPPILDTVAAGLLVSEILLEVNHNPKPDDFATAIAVQASFAALAAASGIYGYHAVGDCREAKR